MGAKKAIITIPESKLEPLYQAINQNIIKYRSDGTKIYVKTGAAIDNYLRQSEKYQHRVIFMIDYSNPEEILKTMQPDLAIIRNKCVIDSNGYRIEKIGDLMLLKMKNNN